MSDGPAEPWDDPTVRDADLEALLRRLAAEPLDEDALVRTASAGHSPAFSTAIRGWVERAEEIRRTVPWSVVPARQRKLAEQRAHFLLAHAYAQSWVDRAEATVWRITDAGRLALDDGTFTFR